MFPKNSAKNSTADEEKQEFEEKTHWRLRMIAFKRPVREPEWKSPSGRRPLQFPNESKTVPGKLWLRFCKTTECDRIPIGMIPWVVQKLCSTLLNVFLFRWLGY